MSPKLNRQLRIGIVGTDLIPFNEAYANQMRVLAEALEASVLTCSDRLRLPATKNGRYYIINVRFFTRKTPLLAFLNGAFFYLLLKLFEWRHDRVLLSAGVESMFLKYLNLKKCIPFVSTIDDEKKAKQFASKIVPNLKKIIVQSSRVRDYLLQLGVAAEKLLFTYPVVDFKRFEYSEPPVSPEFRILFASSPNVETPGENNFEAKGVPLLLEAFKDFIQAEPAHLYLLWRGKYNRELNAKLKELGLEERVTIINEAVDASEWYRKTHVTVIPFTSTWRSPQIPLSALESLVSGRPVVTTDILELADIISKYECGCVCRPTRDSLFSALRRCKDKYLEYQRNCHKVAEVLDEDGEEARIIIKERMP